MSHDMIDAVNPDNIPAAYNRQPALRITVLANVNGECFDVESLNASAAEAARVMGGRQTAGHWSIAYVNRTTCGQVAQAMVASGALWRRPEEWPTSGVYLWAADPSGLIAKGEWVPPVRPIAVQDRYEGGFDLSTVDDIFPAFVAGYIDGRESVWGESAWARFERIPSTPGPVVSPPPAPRPAPVPPSKPSEVTVNLPLLKQGDKAAPVRAVQILTGNPTVDGVFGPVTHGYVVHFQATHNLAQDGVVGGHTWGALLGAPQ